MCDFAFLFSFLKGVQVFREDYVSIQARLSISALRLGSRDGNRMSGPQEMPLSLFISYTETGSASSYTFWVINVM